MEEDLEQDGRLAAFSDRAVAFTVDMALFALGYLVMTEWILLPSQALPYHNLWAGLWTLLFLVYMAFSSCEGRRSLGKALLGIRVTGLDDEALTLGQALVRTGAYLVSSIFSLGFLWSLFNPARQGWHDLAAGSVVVSDRPRGMWERVVVKGGALASIALLAGVGMWQAVWGPRYHRLMTLAYVQVGLGHIEDLQKSYRDENGRFTESLFALSRQSADPDAFLNNMASLFDLEAGFDIKATRKGYTILARARDARRTRIRHAVSA